MGRLVSTTAAAALALAFATPAAAAITANADGSYTTVGAGGGSFTVSFDGYGGEPPAVITDLTSEITFNFISAINGVFTFGYTIENSSTGANDGSRVTVIGFNTNPTFASATVQGVFDNDSSGNIPNFGNVAFCAKGTGGGGCAGGGSGGVLAGTTSTSGGNPVVANQFSLTFDPSVTSITLDDFVVRYQSTGSDREGSAIGRQIHAPEPGTWAMMLLGFGTVGFALRRSRRRDPKLLQIA